MKVKLHILSSVVFLIVGLFIIVNMAHYNNGNFYSWFKKPAQVEIAHVPENVYTSFQGIYIEPENPPPTAYANNQHLTWLFHLVFRSPVEAYRIAEVEVHFRRNGETLWEETYPRAYLEKMEWIEGAIEYTTDYFMKNIEFVDNNMSSIEKMTGPDIPAGSAISLVRFQAARPFFARIDEIQFNFLFQDSTGTRFQAEHQVPIQEWDQKVHLRLPFEGVWIANNGNDLTTGHRRTGLNGLTTYAWDLMKIGENGRTYRTDGKTPEDYYTYNEPVLAAGDGVVTHVRNDIEEYGIGETPPRKRLEEDGDVFAGNLVIIDHGNGEFTLTCHMLAGTVTVKVGDRVKTGQLIGRAGNSGVSQIPHIHFNMMDRADWLQARGIPSLFSNFEQIRSGGSVLLVERGDPMTGWLVRPITSQ